MVVLAIRGRYFRILAAAYEGEVDIAAPRVGENELDRDAIAHGQSFGHTLDFSFDGWMGNPNPDALIRGARDETFKSLAYLIGHRRGGQALMHGSFGLVGVVFLLGAVLRDQSQFVQGIRRFGPGQDSLQQPLRNDVRISTVGRRRMGIPLHRQREMSRRLSFREATTYSPRPKSLITASERSG